MRARDTTMSGLLGRLADWMARTFRESADRSASAGRSAAARLVPDPVREGAPEPGPGDAAVSGADRLLPLLPRVAALKARPDLPPALRTRVEAIDAALGAALAAAQAAQACPGEAPAGVDRRHPCAAAARHALAGLDDTAPEDRPVAWRAVGALLHPAESVRRVALVELTRHPAASLAPLLEARHRRAGAGEREAIVAALRAVGPARRPDAPARARFAAGGRPPSGATSVAPPPDAPPGVLIRHLEHALRDPDPVARLRAVTAAAAPGTPALVLTLIRGLLDPELDVRREAARSISLIVGFDVAFDAAAGPAARQRAAAALRRWWASARLEELAAGAHPPANEGEAELRDPLGAEYEPIPAGDGRAEP